MGTAEHAAAHRAPLTRDRVLRTAVTLADGGGISALTMRGSARRSASRRCRCTTTSLARATCSTG